MKKIKWLKIRIFIELKIDIIGIILLTFWQKDKMNILHGKFWSNNNYNKNNLTGNSINNIGKITIAKIYY